MVSVLILQVKQLPLHNPLAYGKYSISCGLFISSCYSEEDDRRRGAVRARRCCARATPPDFSPRLRSNRINDVLLLKPATETQGRCDSETEDPQKGNDHVVFFPGDIQVGACHQYHWLHALLYMAF